MKSFFQLLGTEFKRIFSNKVLMMVFFGAPVLYGVLFIQVYKKGKLTGMPVVVIDEDQTVLSSKIIDAIDDQESLQVVKVQPDAGNIAREMPSKEYIAVVSIPAGFEGAVLQKRYPELMVDINTANLVTANFASRALQSVLGTVSAGVEIESLKKGGLNAQTASQQFEPFKVNYNRFYNMAGNYQELMMPGIIGTVMQQVIFLALALAFARDFEDGYFSELVRLKQKSWQLILLKTLPFIFMLTAIWLLVGSFFPLFGVDVPVFTSPVFLLTTVFSLACVFFGMLCSLALPRSLNATQMLMVIATPSFLLSGYTWPLEAMPAWIADFARLLPLTQYLEGFRKLSVYKGTLADAMPHIQALLIMMAVYGVLMIILLQIRIIRTQKKLTVTPA